jgi:hypothetical protein
MSIPGFTAAASLYPLGGYRRVAVRHLDGHVWLMVAQDPHQQCINDCMDACRSAGGLGRECVRECLEECAEVPGGGGGGGGMGGGGPLPTCGSGARCFAPELGISCNCGPGQSCSSRCTTSRDCRVRPELCLVVPFPFCLIPQCEVTRLCSVDMFCQ